MDENRKKDKAVNDIKNSIDNLLNVKSTLKTKALTQNDKQKQEFEKIITSLELLHARAVILGDEQINLNLSSYDKLFYDVIDSLILFHFGEEISNLVFFYIYSRVNADGTINHLLDNRNRKVPLNNINDLWELICKIENFKSKKPKK